MSKTVATAKSASRRVQMVLGAMLVTLLAAISLSSWAQSAAPASGAEPGMQRGMRSPGMGDHGMGHRGMHEGMDGAMMLRGSPERVGRMVDHMLDGLDASDAQRAQIKQIAIAAAGDLRAQAEAGRGLRQRAMQAFTAPNVDPAAVEQVRQQMLQQHDQMSRRMTQAIARRRPGADARAARPPRRAHPRPAGAHGRPHEAHAGTRAARRLDGAVIGAAQIIDSARARRRIWSELASHWILCFAQDSSRHRMTQHLLLVDDDARLASMVGAYLGRAGFEVETAGSLARGRELLAGNSYDALVLDLMLPDGDGLDLCRELRGASRTRHLPLLMLTARGEPMDRIVGLELGADDYLPKPFEPRELLARVKALLRRVSPQAAGDDVLRFGRLEVDLGARVARLDGKVCELTGHQFDLLVVLAQSPGRVLSRDQIMDSLKGHPLEAFDRSIDVHISRIRAVIEDDPKAPRRVLTVRGAGYVFARKQDADDAAA